MLLFWSRALLLHLVRHMLIWTKGGILCTSNPKSIVPTDHATLVHGFYTLAVCRTWPWLFAWVGMVPCSVSTRIKREESLTTRCNHATTAATPRLSSIYAAGKYTQVWAKVIQCSPILHSYLSPLEHSLILQMHAIFACFLVCSGFSLVLGIFDQMRLHVKFD